MQIKNCIEVLKLKFYLVGAGLVAQRLVGVRQLLLHRHDDNVDGDDDNADGDDNVDGDENVDGDAKY